MLDQQKKFFVNKKSEVSTHLLELDPYLVFFNSIKLPSKLVTVIKAEQHKTDDMLGWHGLTSITCLSETNEIYNIDVRYAWSNVIFKQNLIDHGWNENILLENNIRGIQCNHKTIIYLCDVSMILKDKQIIEEVEEHLLIGCYWQSIRHLYLQLPFEHPFKHQLHNHDQKDAQEPLLFNYPPVITNELSSNIETVPLLPAHPERKDGGGLRKHGLYKNSTRHEPLISIITVVFNGETYIEQTIQSVINQSYNNIEYIIIDGGSTDKTIDIIKRYECDIDYWISEPDLNIYDAMNKGFICALGEFVNFMNVGDIFFSHKIIELVNFKTCQSSLCGINIFFSNKVSGLIYIKVKKESIPHQALFMKRLDFEKNIFNTSFKYCADAELWSRFNPTNNVIKTVDQIVSISRFGGISTSKKYLIPRMREHWKFEQDKLKIILRFMPKIILCLFLNKELQEKLFFYLKRTN